MLKPQHVTFDELSERLRLYEQKYGYSTIQFYRRYRDGELGDDDDLMAMGWLVSSLPDLAAGPSVHAERVGRGMNIDIR